MNSNHISIDSNIKRASTLPGKFYRDIQIFQDSKEKIFSRSWQLICDTSTVKIPGQIYPFTFMEELLEEPLLLIRDFADQLHCLSNVCTHRGNLLVKFPSTEKQLRCRYHGRRFDLSGKCIFMPEFEQVSDFPGPNDNLCNIDFKIWKQFIFVTIGDPLYSFESVFTDIESRIGWMPVDSFVFDPSRSRNYLIQANWALYCDNYLEGFHIPYVHTGLSEVLDYGSYSTELYAYHNLQLGITNKGEESFVLPKSSPDYGKEVAAYYYWIFPNLMLNFYPWGLSINIVKPLSINQTKITYLSYIWNEEKLQRGAGAGLDRVEREDEAIVEQVQKGLQSRFYSSGRFSPSREQGIHHFHTLLAKLLY